MRSKGTYAQCTHAFAAIITLIFASACYETPGPITSRRAIYNRDHLGNTSLVSETNSTGGVTHAQAFNYDPYGEFSFMERQGSSYVTRTSASATATNYLFTGHHYDRESGLYYARARFYEPKLGRFLSSDPALGGFSVGDSFKRLPQHTQALNSYSYVEGSPSSAVDPTGKSILSWIGAVDQAAGEFVVKPLVYHVSVLSSATNSVIEGAFDFLNVPQTDRQAYLIGIPMLQAEYSGLRAISLAKAPVPPAIASAPAEVVTLAPLFRGTGRASPKGFNQEFPGFQLIRAKGGRMTIYQSGQPNIPFDPNLLPARSVAFDTHGAAITPEIALKMLDRAGFRPSRNSMILHGGCNSCADGSTFTGTSDLAATLYQQTGVANVAGDVGSFTWTGQDLMSTGYGDWIKALARPQQLGPWRVFSDGQ